MPDIHRVFAIFDFDVTSNREGIGAFTSEIHLNTPASRTRLRPGDEIIEINERSVDKKRRTSLLTRLEQAAFKQIKVYEVDTIASKSAI